MSDNENTDCIFFLRNLSALNIQRDFRVSLEMCLSHDKNMLAHLCSGEQSRSRFFLDRRVKRVLFAFPFFPCVCVFTCKLIAFSFWKFLAWMECLWYIFKCWKFLAFVGHFVEVYDLYLSTCALLIKTKMVKNLRNPPKLPKSHRCQSPATSKNSIKAIIKPLKLFLFHIHLFPTVSGEEMCEWANDPICSLHIRDVFVCFPSCSVALFCSVI